MFRIKILTLAFTLFGFGLVLAQEEVPPWPEFPEIPEIELFQEMEPLPEIEPFYEFNFSPDMELFSDSDIVVIHEEGIPFAEVPPFPEDSPEGPGDPPERAEKMQERVESLRVWKLLETLDLTEEQSNAFLPAFRQFQKSESEYNQNRRELLDQLQESLESKDQKKISEIVGKLKQNRLQMEQNRVQFLAKVDKILSLEQQAKFLLFQNHFERRLRDEIMQLRVYTEKGPSWEEMYRNLEEMSRKGFAEQQLKALRNSLEETKERMQEMQKKYEEMLKKYQEHYPQEKPN